jgi:hypothetical protein
MRFYIIVLLILLGLTNLSHGAITVDSSSSVVTATNTATTASWSHTVGTGSNRILVVGISMVSATTTNTVTSVSYGGSAMSRIGTVNRIATILYRTEIWYMRSPPSGTSTITVNLSNGASITAGATSFAGVNLSDPLGSFVSATGINSSLPTVNATTVAGDMVIDTVNTRGGRTLTVGAGQTVRWNPSSAGGDGWSKGAGSTELATGGTTTMSWRISKKSYWTIGAVPIHAALPAPTATKSFSPDAIPINGGSSMTITLTNPNTTSVMSGGDMFYIQPGYAGDRRECVGLPCFRSVADEQSVKSC